MDSQNRLNARWIRGMTKQKSGYGEPSVSQASVDDMLLELPVVDSVRDTAGMNCQRLSECSTAAKNV